MRLLLTNCALAIGVLFSTSCGNISETSSNIQSSVTQNSSVLGNWQDEDQLLLSIDDGSIVQDKVIYGFDLDVNQEIDRIENDSSQKVVNWMKVTTTRSFTEQEHKIKNKCETKTKEIQELELSAPLVLNESLSTYEFPEEERFALAAVGEYDCYIHIAGDNAERNYELSADGNELYLILGDKPEDRIPLRRIN